MTKKIFKERIVYDSTIVIHFPRVTYQVDCFQELMKIEIMEHRFKGIQQASLISISNRIQWRVVLRILKQTNILVNV